MVWRLHRYRTWLVLAILLNVLILLYLSYKQHTQLGSPEDDKSVLGLDGSGPFSEVTIVLREFEEFENEVLNTVEQIQKLFPHVNVVIIGDKTPYPPWKTKNLRKKLFHYIPLEGNLWEPMLSSRPESVIKTEYIFIIPDGTTFPNENVFLSLVHDIRHSNVSVIAVPFTGTAMRCSSLKFSIKEWTLEYLDGRGTGICNFVSGEHAVFMRTKDLFKLSSPYLRPWPLSLYIQGYLHQWTIKTSNSVILNFARELFGTDAHNKWKHKHNAETRTEHMYRELGIKLVTRGSDHKQWYGCTKETQRCFGTVKDDMPDYLYKRRWTPPCCLRTLRETARHVFEILDLCSSRYWLEGGSLLGAARHGDIIPWDYDVDVGIYLEDFDKCDYLLRCKDGPYIDEDGFVWEKAREGEFYHVQYSETNRLHVDIFPFFSSNGTMTKNTWIKSHRQDTEFPEKYLRPLTKIRFVGMNVNSPNNVREFLEYKFGPGVIENPKYPNSQDPV